MAADRPDDTARDRAALATSPPGHRAVELAAIVAFVALGATAAWRLGAHATADDGLRIVAAAILGLLAADLASGLVHWACDTWGSLDTPLLGKAFLRPFREHHVDPQAITRHDFVETNGNNCLVALPVLGLALLPPLGPEAPAGTFVAAFLLSLGLATMATNQIHKWAHQDAPPRLVAWLQRARLLLPPTCHAAHHRPPYAADYCITLGWLNAPLRAIGFFGRLERAIMALTGAVPRRDEQAGAVGGATAPRS